MSELLAVLLDGRGSVVLKEVSTPVPSKGDILVKMRSCGLCGTDVEKISGQYTAAMPVIGHEPAGTVEDASEDVEGLRKGDRVFVHHHVPCGECWYCVHGSETMCPTYRNTNIAPGGFAEYFLVPSVNIQKGGVLKLPSNVSFDEGSLIEPLACCIRGLQRADYESAERIIVIGCGPVGLMHTSFLSHRGKDVIAADVNKSRLEVASKFGARHQLKSDEVLRDNVLQLTHGIGADLAIVATGSNSAFINAIQSVRKGGKVLLFGVPAKGSEARIDLSWLFNSEISIVTSYGATERETRIALGLIASGELDLTGLITHRFRLEEFEKALNIYHSGSGMKIIITS